MYCSQHWHPQDKSAQYMSLKLSSSMRVSKFSQRGCYALHQASLTNPDHNSVCCIALLTPCSIRQNADSSDKNSIGYCCRQHIPLQRVLLLCIPTTAAAAASLSWNFSNMLRASIAVFVMLQSLLCRLCCPDSKGVVAIESISPLPRGTYQGGGGGAYLRFFSCCGSSAVPKHFL